MRCGLRYYGLLLWYMLVGWPLQILVRLSRRIRS